MCGQDLPKSIILEHVYGASESPCRVKIERNSKGYNWEVSMSGDDFPTILKKLEEVNEALKIKFGGVRSA